MTPEDRRLVKDVVWLLMVMVVGVLGATWVVLSW